MSECKLKDGIEIKILKGTVVKIEGSPYVLKKSIVVKDTCDCICLDLKKDIKLTDSYLNKLNNNT